MESNNAPSGKESQNRKKKRNDLPAALAPNLAPNFNGLGRAFFVAFQTTDAFFGSVIRNSEVLFARIGFHRADLVASPTIYAVRSTLREYGRKAIENGKASAQRTKYFAEETFVAHDQDDDSKENN